jgi:hypothetical protein
MAEHSTVQTSTQAPIMTPVPADEPGSGHIEPGHETAGSGGYTGADGTTGYSHPDMSGDEDEHASLSPLIAVGEVALAATMHAVAPPAALIVDGIAMAGGIFLETGESVSHFGEGAGPATSAPAAPAAPATQPAADDGGKTGVTADGAGYSTVGEEPTSSSASGSFATDEPETEETLDDFGTGTIGDTGTDATVDTGSDAFDAGTVDVGSDAVDAGTVDAGSAALPVDDFTPSSNGDLGLITDAETGEA